MTLGRILPRVDGSASRRPEQRDQANRIGLLWISNCYPGLSHAALERLFQEPETSDEMLRRRKQLNRIAPLGGGAEAHRPSADDLGRNSAQGLPTFCPLLAISPKNTSRPSTALFPFFATAPAC